MYVVVVVKIGAVGHGLDMSVCLYMNGRLDWRCPGCFAEMR